MSSSPSRLAQQVEGSFEDSAYWEYEKSLGNGSYGLAVLLKQHARHGGQRMAIKIALGTGVGELRAEIGWLKKLHGAKHIVRMLGSSDGLAQSDSNLENTDQLLGNVPVQTAFQSLERLGPILALEYLENGNKLTRVVKVVRASIGMAFPVGSPLGTPPVLETIPTDGTPIQGIQHNDIAPRNVVIGMGDEIDEHYIGHIFKLIDFGGADCNNNPFIAPKENLYFIANFVAFFINMADLPEEPTTLHKGFETHGGQLLPQTWGVPFPWLDPDLAELIAECMYISRRRRPTLQEVLNRATNAVHIKTANSFPEPHEETDEAINQFVQTYILDPPPPQATSSQWTTPSPESYGGTGKGKAPWGTVVL
ncbi:hypothetical protein NUW58_g6724 [Xylaria curta]|uniref:Uncharacterized protein n=1 Tax=Xylaria curta TaxID=42375 RepID=A0ACC1NPM9_9PEZI|nr:hypothetical protein NUW58_g6724 [Xylaria curta]